MITIANVQLPQPEKDVILELWYEMLMKMMSNMQDVYAFQYHFYLDGWIIMVISYKFEYIDRVTPIIGDIVMLIRGYRVGCINR